MGVTLAHRPFFPAREWSVPPSKRICMEQLQRNVACAYRPFTPSFSSWLGLVTHPVLEVLSGHCAFCLCVVQQHWSLITRLHLTSSFYHYRCCLVSAVGTKSAEILSDLLQSYMLHNLCYFSDFAEHFLTQIVLCQRWLCWFPFYLPSDLLH